MTSRTKSSTAGRQMILTLLLLLSAPLMAMNIYVFYPTTARAITLQLEVDNTCPTLNLTVFGRHRDFQKQVIATPPDAVLAPRILIDRFTDYQPVIAGVYQGQHQQTYYLARIDQTPKNNDTRSMKVGVIDILGHKQMPKFVNNVLATQSHIKLVTKLEDLLPMLSFGLVDRIWISEQQLAFIKTRTHEELYVTPSTKSFGLATIAVTKDMDQRYIDYIFQCVSRFDPTLNRLFGVDNWEQ